MILGTRVMYEADKRPEKLYGQAVEYRRETQKRIPPTLGYKAGAILGLCHAKTESHLRSILSARRGRLL
jgi:hypothetical protein